MQVHGRHDKWHILNLPSANCSNKGINHNGTHPMADHFMSGLPLFNSFNPSNLFRRQHSQPTSVQKVVNEHGLHNKNCIKELLLFFSSPPPPPPQLCVCKNSCTIQSVDLFKILEVIPCWCMRDEQLMYQGANEWRPLTKPYRIQLNVSGTPPPPFQPLKVAHQGHFLFILR